MLISNLILIIKKKKKMNIKEFCYLNNLTLDEIFEMLPVEFDFQNWFENVY